MVRARASWSRTLLVLTGLIAACTCAALLLLANLDWPWVKRIVQRQAAAQGLSLDYAEAGVTLAGLAVRGLAVRSPEVDADLAPNLLYVAAVEARWSLLAGRIDAARVRGATVEVVVDRDGVSSLDRLLARMPSSPPPTDPPVPLSEQLSHLLPADLEAHLEVEPVVLRVHRRAAQAASELRGLRATAQLVNGKLEARVGPSELRLSHEGHAAAAQLDLQLSMQRGGESAAELQVSQLRQDFDAKLTPIPSLLKLSLRARPAPLEHRTVVALHELVLLSKTRFTAELVLPDEGHGTSRVEHARGSLDLAELARLSAPLVGALELEAEPFACEVRQLELAPPWRGTAHVTGRIARLRAGVQRADELALALHAEAGRPASLLIEGRTLALSDLRAQNVVLSLHAPASGAVPLPFSGQLSADALELVELALKGATLRYEGTLRERASLDLTGRLEVEQVGGGAQLEQAQLTFALHEGVLAQPASASTGRLTMRGRLARASAAELRAEELALQLDAELGKLSHASLTLGVGKLTLPSLPPAPLRAAITAERIELDHDAPAQSRAALRFQLDHGKSHAEGSAEGSLAALRWDLRARGERLGPAQALAITSKGRYANIIEHETTIEVTQLAEAEITARRVKLHASSRGTLRKLSGELALTVDDLRSGGVSLGSPSLTLEGDVDLDAYRVDLRLDSLAPKSKLKLFAELAPSGRLAWRLDGQARELAALNALLPGMLDWQNLGLTVRGRGAVQGLLRRSAAGVPVLVQNPVQSARGAQSFSLEARDLRYADGAATTATAKVLDLQADLTLADTHRATVRMNAPQLAGSASGVNLSVRGLSAALDANMTRAGAGKADLTLKVAEMGQSAVASYPIRELLLSLALARDPSSVLKIEAKLDNPAAGTHLRVNGELDDRALPAEDAVAGRHSITLVSTIEQELDKLDAAPEQLRARGRISVPIRIESGDLSLFQGAAAVRLEHVSLELPKHGFLVRGVEGHLPVAQQLVVSEAGISLVSLGERSLYPEVRFADQQPFLGNTNFVSLDQLRIAGHTLGPLAGNFRIDHDLIALDQLEMQALGGTVAGQTRIELHGPDTRVTFRGKLTGLRPTKGSERFDANAALTLEPYKLGLEGRVEIVRIGRGHLLDLLDVIDPFRADVALNRIRLALKAGYPKRVRLSFSHGFASLAVELGGLASAVRIDEIRGIPIGPALTRWLQPILEEEP